MDGNVRLGGVADDDLDVVEALLGDGVARNLGQLGGELQARHDPVGAGGMGPQHGGVADVDADLED